jgi:hypothetical protein
MEPFCILGRPYLLLFNVISARVVGLWRLWGLWGYGIMGQCGGCGAARDLQGDPPGHPLGEPPGDLMEDHMGPSGGRCGSILNCFRVGPT